MLNLITDREQAHVDRRNALARKGWNAMTEAEQAEWTGSIFSAELLGYTDPVNLMPNSGFVPPALTSMFFSGKKIRIAVFQSGAVSYAAGYVLIGPAADLENKTLTLSVEGIEFTGAAYPEIRFVWRDDNGVDGIDGAVLTEAGSITFNTGENVNGREYLAVNFRLASMQTVGLGQYVDYIGVMLEFGDTAHPYVPYIQAFPTAARKGAYNYTDLNRVEMAVKEVSAVLGLSLTTKTDWRQWDIPKQADMERFLGNIETIRAMGIPRVNTPKAPTSMAKLTYTGANDIEKILLDIYATAENVLRSGEIYCGEV